VDYVGLTNPLYTHILSEESRVALTSANER